MVKQKVVIKLTMEDARKRSKALKTAAGFSGVTSTSLEGEDKIVVVGDGFDSIALTTALRKRMRYAELISLGEEENGEKEREEEASSSNEAPICMPYHGGVMRPYTYVYYEPTYYPNSCNVM
ncbi:heavy metal-associated isoprenylated plant protein 16-like [Typha angustifolia]|uniref:heavy metal-associated isoprenylated plant protein 16-like n=1 Tax=Typha angustifolia TaxID=59011 RepID=UPI003C2E67AA